MGNLFGTDGIRGIVGENLTVELAFHTGQAIAAVLKEEKGSCLLYTSRQSDLRAQRARQLLCALAGAHRHRADGKNRLQADLSLRRRREGVLAAQRRRRGDPALKI